MEERILIYTEGLERSIAEVYAACFEHVTRTEEGSINSELVIFQLSTIATTINAFSSTLSPFFFFSVRSFS